jgi:hypothetical protein
MRHQQNLARYDVAVVVLQQGFKRLSELVALVSKALSALEGAPKGQATIVKPG